MKHTLHFTLLATAFTANTCRRTPPPSAPPGAPTETSPTPGQPNTNGGSPYRVEAVTHGGTLRGRVTWQGDRPAMDPLPVGATGNPAVCGTTQPFPALALSASGGVASTVVWLKDIDHGAAPTTRAVTVDQHDCRYQPHVVAIPVGADLRMTNSDPGLLHNVHAYYGYEGEESWFNAATPVGIPVVRKAERVGVSHLICDAGHTWMSGYVHVFPHPYYAVSDGDGNWSIPNVPPGTYTLHFWHEGWVRSEVPGHEHPAWSPAWERDRAVRVDPDGTVTADLTLTREGPTG